MPQFGLLGDWSSIEPFCPGSSDACLHDPGWTSGDATSSFYYIQDLEAVVDMATALNRTADAKRYEYRAGRPHPRE